MAVSFKVTSAERALVDQIVDRARINYARGRTSTPVDPVALAMDLRACHANGSPLDFEKLLAADDAGFGHDIGGITQHLDRATGKLTGHFSPRCVKPEAEA